jgi:large subunit ribosomal protein L3
MPKGILGKKLGMTQVFDKDGKVFPVTVVEAGPCVVVQRKLNESDGYNAIQLGFDKKRAKLVSKPEKGHFEKASVDPTKYVREIRTENAADFNIGQEIKADIFTEGELVDVIGTSKGKGYTGAVQRWNISRGPMTYGSMYHRRPGSGGSIDGARVFKGRHLAGRVGNTRVTIQGLRIVRVDADRNLLLIRGAVPGTKGAYVIVKESIKRRD